MDRLYKELREFGDVHLKRPLARYTTFKVGGPADRFIDVTDTDKLAKLLSFLTGRGVDYFVLGGGSNVLLPDNGLRGVVIRVHTNKVAITGTTIRAEAGVMFASLVTTSIAHKLTGLEWAAGLPGTVGGAVRGNAGAMGGDVSQILSKVLVWQDGDVLELTPKECDFAYRDSVFKHGGGVVLVAWFELAPGDPLASLKRVQDIIKQRSGHYPPYPSGGSFFKNVLLKDWPKNGVELPNEFVAAGRVPAGWLSEQAELKGFQVGGAMVSEEHGNFIINRNDATQEDVLKIVEEVKARVYTKFGVELEEEVHIIH